ncbi:type III pantothenate kinase [bacterium]|nr:type III pantothenate kinase [bacterium]
MNSFLAIDIGNTHTTVGLWESGEWMHEWRFSSRAIRTQDEWTVFLSNTLSRAGFPDRRIESCGIASVVPALTGVITGALQNVGLAPTLVTHRFLGGVRIAYDPPEAVGADRVCGVAAALHKFGPPVVVVDLGTATVLDVVSRERVYLGGLIAPGVATAAESLGHKAALLPSVELAFPPKVIGETSIHAIQSGVLYGTLAMIDGLVRRIQEEIGESPVIATGGFAELIQSKSLTITTVDRHLVLEGIRLLCSGEFR